MNTYTVGLDLGFAADYSALCVLRTEKETHPLEGVNTEPSWEEIAAHSGWKATPPTHYAEHVERVPLGTPYPDVVATTVALMSRPELITRDNQGRERGPRLVVDKTGVGQPVVQLLRAAGVSPIGVTITGGDAVAGGSYDYKVPKRDLISGTQVLLQGRSLKFAPGMPFVEQLRLEFETYQMKIDLTTGHDSYGQWREGKHDDLVLAVALAAWWAERQYRWRRRVVGGQRSTDV